MSNTNDTRYLVWFPSETPDTIYAESPAEAACKHMQGQELTPDMEVTVHVVEHYSGKPCHQKIKFTVEGTGQP